jgi:glycerophosphoryl diester phosphodiesterase
MGAAGGESVAVVTPEPVAETNDRLPRRFHVVSMRGSAIDPFIDGNAIEALRAARAQGVRDVEVDLVLTRDGALVTSHGVNQDPCPPFDRTTLAEAKSCTLRGGRHVATFEETLELGFDTVFADLKNTRPKGADGATAVEAAAAAVTRAGARDRAVLMLYEAFPESVASVRRYGVRAGLKGYPAETADSQTLVHRAAALGFELLCVKAEQVDARLIADAARLGVWLLPWSTRFDLARWKHLAEAGAGGLIVLHGRLAMDRVLPAWKDVRLSIR